MPQVLLRIGPGKRKGDVEQAADASLVEDAGLETMANIILFTDAPARPDDDVPEGDRRGYWADAYDEDDPAAVTGSRLWTLDRRTLTPELLRDAETISAEALEVMVREGICARITTSSRRIDDERAELTASFYRTEDDSSPYQATWELHFRQAA